MFVDVGGAEESLLRDKTDVDIADFEAGERGEARDEVGGREVDGVVRRAKVWLPPFETPQARRWRIRRKQYRTEGGRVEIKEFEELEVGAVLERLAAPAEHELDLADGEPGGNPLMPVLALVRVGDS